MESQTHGTLILDEGYLRVESIQNVVNPVPTTTKEHRLIVWPYGYTYFKQQDNIIQVRDDRGQPWAWVGDNVFIGGGLINRDALKLRVNESLVPQEPGNYWLASPTTNDPYIIVQPPNTQIQPSTLSEIEGSLVLDQEVLCLKPPADKQYTPIFPHGYSIRVEGQTLQIYKNKVDLVASVGNWVTLKGYEISPKEVKSLYSLENLPSDWQEPYWVVTSITKQF
jgi:hypothetical protein